MAAPPIQVFALTPPPVAVALLDGTEFASMALLAVVLAAVSIAVRRLPRPGRPTKAGPRASLASTRARS